MTRILWILLEVCTYHRDSIKDFFNGSPPFWTVAWELKSRRLIISNAFLWGSRILATAQCGVQGAFSKKVYSLYTPLVLFIREYKTATPTIIMFSFSGKKKEGKARHGPLLIAKMFPV